MLIYNGHIILVNIKTQMKAQINQLNHVKLRQAFESVKLYERDYISSNALEKVLANLGQEDFDGDIFEQLWEQCKLNSQGQTKIGSFIDNLIRAEAILIDKQKQTSLQIKAIEQKINSKMLSNSDKIELNTQLYQLSQLRTGKPFAAFSGNTTIRRGNEPVPVGYNNPLPTTLETSIYNQQHIPPSSMQSKKQNLSWIFYLTCICMFAQVLVYLYMNAFMNSVLFLLIFSMYFFEYFDRKTIRLLFWFTIFSLIVDIIWFVVQAKNVWSTHQYGLWPNFLNGYLKLSVALISLVFICKILITLLLGTQYNIDESQPQEVNICNVLFVLRSDNVNAPLQKALKDVNMSIMRGSQNIQPPSRS